MVKYYITKNYFQTRKIGEVLAKEILKTSPTPNAIIVALVGELGGGKTTFLQGFARGLDIKEKILSPTFIIMRKFKIPCPRKNPKIKNFYHIDCYRIQKLKEILDLGFKKIISNSQNIVVIEWADKIKKLLPQKTLILDFKFVNIKTRKIVVRLKK